MLFPVTFKPEAIRSGVRRLLPLLKIVDWSKQLNITCKVVGVPNWSEVSFGCYARQSPVIDA
jgi:hypothetical protein